MELGDIGPRLKEIKTNNGKIDVENDEASTSEEAAGMGKKMNLKHENAVG